MKSVWSRLYFVLIFLPLVLSFDPTSYAKNATLDGNYQIFWTVNGDTIALGLKVQTIGWVGFGIAEQTSGSMPGADIVTGWVIDGVVSHQDRFAVAKAYPSEDACNDWNLVSGIEQNGFTILEYTRKLDTGDLQDRAIPGHCRIVFAYGTTDSFSYHSSNRGATALTLYGPEQPSIPTDLPSWSFINTNYAVPVQETTYYDVSFTASLPANDVHVVAFEAIVSSQTKAHVHHFLVYGCVSESNCDSLIWAWTPGMPGFVVPSMVGFRFGSTSLKGVKLQIHYDNPNGVTGLVDNSGVKLYYTSNLRQFDGGILEMGDPLVSNPNSIRAGSGTVEYEYSCPSECTTKLNAPLNVIGVMMHMHQIGSQIWGTQWRDGQLIRETARVDFWDFGFQQHTHVNFTIQPGDRLNLHCIFKRQGTNVAFGKASSQEMCLQYVMYYPMINSIYCGYVHVGGRNFTGCGSNVLTNGSSQPYNPIEVDPFGGNAIQFGTEGNCSASGSTVARLTSASNSVSVSSGVVSSATSTSTPNFSSNQNSESEEVVADSATALFSLTMLISCILCIL